MNDEFLSSASRLTMRVFLKPNKDEDFFLKSTATVNVLTHERKLYSKKTLFSYTRNVIRANLE